ncbi:muts domain V-domain-containing protein [Irpex rosettiformis]|uniref:Muts domain V-domain-containing protein n=1 Tax=Irpex rosettiformis TaxID=378272 RepID=A0ACB8U6F3_9APHY|nr:muts domain V-domain-containing protein [Irpex rosettiformis]
MSTTDSIALTTRRTFTRTTSVSDTHSIGRPWTGRSAGGRLNTAQSRPGTGRPQTAASSKREASYVLAILEGRGMGKEVGIAALDRDTGRVNLIQLSDVPTYVKTLHQMHLHYPSLILVPDTFLSLSDASLLSGGKRPNTTSVLVQSILEEFDSAPVEPVMRKYWSDNAGLEFVNHLCVEDDERAATLVALSNKYYALSAACALFKHAEAKLNLRFSASSLRIRYVQVEGTMMIDPETARNLELVSNVMSRRSSHSLFGILDHSYTAMAARLLRTTLLAPVTVQSAIDARLDVVDELVQTEERFHEVKDALKAFNKIDFDKLISSLASSEARETSSAKTASSRVSQMLNLRDVVKNIPMLAKALQGSRSQLLQVIREMIMDERLERIEQLVGESLNDNAMAQKGGLGAVNARVYAVKANYNRLLDVARETYKENVGDIFALSNALSQEHDLRLMLVWQDNGFVFTLKKNDLEESGMKELPKGFVNVVGKKGKWVFSSVELKKRNARMKDALDETLILSDKIIADLVAEIIVDFGALYKASEAVALLDMLWGFAHVSIVRPEFTGTLAIKSGRHPILEGVQAAGTLVPNDVYCSEASSFQIVDGLAGKSTYLRQIALLAVMAMSGSFVPAEYASFRIHDALLTRLSNDDDMEKSLSTFANEMASSAMILGIATEHSLILIDEVGRGTSPREGVGISHAIAEHLIKLKSYVFFATHFNELVTTLSRQPSVVNLHLSVHRSRQTNTNFGMAFQYKIVDGAPDELTHYGLDLARLADLPEDVLIEARRVSEKLTEIEERKKEESKFNKVAVRRKAMLRLKHQLTQVLDHSNLPDEELVDYLARMQKEFARVLQKTL